MVADTKITNCRNTISVVNSTDRYRGATLKVGGLTSY